MSLRELVEQKEKEEGNRSNPALSSSPATTTPVNGGKLRLIPPANFTTDTPITVHSFSCHTDIVELLADSATYKKYEGSRPTPDTTTVRVPAFSLCIKSACATIAKECRNRRVKSPGAATVCNLAAHLGLLNFEIRPEVAHLKAVMSSYVDSKTLLRSYQDEAFDKLCSTFSLPSGARKNFNLPSHINDPLSELSGSLGVSKGVLLTAAIYETLACQPEAYFSRDHRETIRSAAAHFRGFLRLKGVMLDAGLETALKNVDE